MRLLILFALLFSSMLARSQRNVYTDHNKLIQNKAENGGYYLIGPYKVQGNPYYVKESVQGAMYSPGETATNVQLRYDLFNQNVEFLTTSNPEQPLVKEPGDIDSFTLFKDEKHGLNQNIKFVYSKIIGANDKFYYAELVKGTKYSLYRKTYTDLVIPSVKIGAPEMREFEKHTQYFYLNESTGEIKKIKPNTTTLMKEFEDVKNLTVVLQNNNMSRKPDEAMIAAFNYLNE